MSYDGTLIIVSHDRDFLDGLVDKIYEFRGKKIREYTGDIYAFLKARKLAALKDNEKKGSIARQASNAKSSESSNKEQYEARKEQERARRKISNQISKTEAKIQELENKQAEIEAWLANPKNIAEAEGNPYAEFEMISKKLESELSHWEKLQERLESL